jgi:hypothetical protein
LFYLNTEHPKDTEIFYPVFFYVFHVFCVQSVPQRKNQFKNVAATAEPVFQISVRIEEVAIFRRNIAYQTWWNIASSSDDPSFGRFKDKFYR